MRMLNAALALVLIGTAPALAGACVPTKSVGQATAELDRAGKAAQDEQKAANEAAWNQMLVEQEQARAVRDEALAHGPKGNNSSEYYNEVITQYNAEGAAIVERYNARTEAALATFYARIAAANAEYDQALCRK